MSANHQLKVCNQLGGDKGGEGSRQTVTKCAKGGLGSKIGGRPMTYFLNGPLLGKKCNNYMISIFSPHKVAFLPIRERRK